MASEGGNALGTLPADTNPTQQVNIVHNAFYISPNENINVSLVTQPLEGPENYISWKKGMLRSLGFKKKLGFIDGRLKRPENNTLLK